MYEQFANNASTTLNGLINDSTTSVVVTDGSVFPSSGNFRVQVDEETMLVTARSSNTLTVIRGAEGTSAQAHNDAVTIKQLLTKNSFLRAFADVIGPVGNGDHLPGPQNYIVDGSGNLLTDADFTWVNQGGSSTTDLTNGNIQLDLAKTSGNNARSLVRTAPSTPYEITISLAPCLYADNVSHVGMVFRESSTSKIILFGINGDRELRIQKWTNNTTFSSSVLGWTTWAVPVNPWMRLGDDGTDLTFSYSPNGYQFQDIYTEGRTSFMAGGPNQVGWYGQANDTTRLAGAILTHWSGE